jgi:hypothetical protein
MSECKNYNPGNAICWQCVAPKQMGCFVKAEQSPQAEQATASCLSELLDREELEIVKLCKSNQNFAYENAGRIADHMRKKAGCSLYDCVVMDKLISIIAKAL